MEIGVGVYEAPGSAPAIAQQEERREDQLRQEQAISRDTVTISDEARERIQVNASGEASDDMRRRDAMHDPSSSGGSPSFGGKNGGAANRVP